ncbi:5-formyltetrahydrofolate cyclo-ligase [Aequitasia blattaphilus]|uniref:5-formyltetrahydrofolate cyclo-ligase n=1 Tax=Aequitasia blattaphilus TaxID=2949332 RepID=A0ABT1E778_9FIRM|nr:5-formyltetrahydrofolate cyclo-ligase [Aequitasia blattaphilus]MCP1101682.1 5-formyltetrahydrofolate cyclo-ligase [Aequitasia blattaphilus]MCR8614322.1 5-formyltetrahydrofolate cyclo-ligase [Aequitasia blattaphilus]
METKREIRALLLKKRGELSKDFMLQSSAEITAKILTLKEFINTNNIYLYCDMRNEVLTTNLIQISMKQNKTVWLPKTYGKTMKFHRFTGFDDLTIGNFQVREPNNRDVPREENGFVLVPGLAFDLKKHRLGYGMGYYDQYLKEHNTLTKAGIAYDFQLLATLPKESYDVPMDYIVTDRRLI